MAKRAGDSLSRLRIARSRRDDSAWLARRGRGAGAWLPSTRLRVARGRANRPRPARSCRLDDATLLPTRLCIAHSGAIIARNRLGSAWPEPTGLQPTRLRIAHSCAIIARSWLAAARTVRARLPSTRLRVVCVGTIIARANRVRFKTRPPNLRPTRLRIAHSCTIIARANGTAGFFQAESYHQRACVYCAQAR